LFPLLPNTARGKPAAEKGATSRRQKRKDSQSQEKPPLVVHRTNKRLTQGASARHNIYIK
jgi:ribosomal protein L18